MKMLPVETMKAGLKVHLMAIALLMVSPSATAVGSKNFIGAMVSPIMRCYTP
jgi:hypothetical protein